MVPRDGGARHPLSPDAGVHEMTRCLPARFCLSLARAVARRFCHLFGAKKPRLLHLPAARDGWGALRAAGAARSLLREGGLRPHEADRRGHQLAPLPGRLPQRVRHNRSSARALPASLPYPSSPTSGTPCSQPQAREFAAGDFREGQRHRQDLRFWPQRCAGPGWHPLGAPGTPHTSHALHVLQRYVTWDDTLPERQARTARRPIARDSPLAAHASAALTPPPHPLVV